MKRLTKDDTATNVEAMLNFAYAADREVKLAYADGEENITLAEYLSHLAKGKGCDCSLEDILNGDACGCDCGCDCYVNVLNTVAIQAAELRARLKAIEDILGDEYDLERLKQLLAGEEKPCMDCPAVFAVKSLAHSDLQPVVRCKDCRWYQIRKWDDGKPEYDCRKTQGLLDVRPEDFCSYGERRQRNE